MASTLRTRSKIRNRKFHGTYLLKTYFTFEFLGTRLPKSHTLLTIQNYQPKSKMSTFKMVAMLVICISRLPLFPISCVGTLDCYFSNRFCFIRLLLH